MAMCMSSFTLLLTSRSKRIFVARRIRQLTIRVFVPLCPLLACRGPVPPVLTGVLGRSLVEDRRPLPITRSTIREGITIVRAHGVQDLLK